MHDFYRALRILSDGGVVVVGDFWDSVSVDGLNGTGTSLSGTASYPSALIARYLPDGQLAWARAAQGVSRFHDVDQASTGAVVAYGTANNGVIFGVGEPGQATATNGGNYLVYHQPNGVKTSEITPPGRDTS